VVEELLEQAESSQTPDSQARIVNRVIIAISTILTRRQRRINASLSVTPDSRLLVNSSQKRYN
jgi:hypothetical protein